MADIKGGRFRGRGRCRARGKTGRRVGIMPETTDELESRRVARKVARQRAYGDESTSPQLTTDLTIVGDRENTSRYRVLGHYL